MKLFDENYFFFLFIYLQVYFPDTERAEWLNKASMTTNNNNNIYIKKQRQKVKIHIGLFQ